MPRLRAVARNVTFASFDKQVIGYELDYAQFWLESRRNKNFLKFVKEKITQAHAKISLGPFLNILANFNGF